MNRRRFSAAFVSASVGGLIRGLDIDVAGQAVDRTGNAPLPDSGGLGLTSTEFLTRWGEPDYRSTIGTSTYKRHGYSVKALSRKSGWRHDQLYIDFIPEVDVEDQLIDKAISAIVPYDTEVLDRERWGSGYHVLRCWSDWLRERFADVEPYWKPYPNDGELGDFTIQIKVNRDSGVAYSVSIYTGRRSFNRYGD